MMFISVDNAVSSTWSSAPRTTLQFVSTLAYFDLFWFTSFMASSASNHFLLWFTSIFLLSQCHYSFSDYSKPSSFAILSPVLLKNCMRNILCLCTNHYISIITFEFFSFVHSHPWLHWGHDVRCFHFHWVDMTPFSSDPFSWFLLFGVCMWWGWFISPPHDCLTLLSEKAYILFGITTMHWYLPWAVSCCPLLVDVFLPWWFVTSFFWLQEWCSWTIQVQLGVLCSILMVSVMVMMLLWFFQCHTTHLHCLHGKFEQLFCAFM